MRDKFFSVVNIFGLSAGLVCCILIALYLNYETSYDSYNKNIKDLYLVGTIYVKTGDKDAKWATTPFPMAQGLKQEFGEIKESGKLLNLYIEDKTLLQYTPEKGERRSFLEPNGFLADPSFFTLFPYDFIEGSAADALNGPYTIVISTEVARKMFADQPALNKVIHVASNTNGEHDYTVTGVFAPLKGPSHINANFFMTFKGGKVERKMQKHITDFASNNMFYTYILLQPGADAHRLQEEFPAFIHKYADNDLKRIGFYKKQFLIPVRDIHFTDDIPVIITPTASRTYLYILASIAVFTLLIACINFMNLSTARSWKRASEVGIRKVLGAEKSALVGQFLGESLMMTLIAFVFAMVISVLFLPLFGKLSGKDIEVSFTRDWKILVTFLGITIITGLIAGSYPAFYLSSFNPVKVLKGKLTNSLAVIAMRKGLVVFQFVISIALITATMIIAGQMRYLRTADLGFDRDRQIIIPLRSSAAKSIFSSLKNELKANPRILSIGASEFYPGMDNLDDNAYYKEGQTVRDAILTKMNWVDADYLKTLNIKLEAGRFFSSQFNTDTSNRLIVNENAIKVLGFTSPENAIGKKIYYEWLNQVFECEIIGVAKDFNFRDMHLPVTPYGFKMMSDHDDFSYIIVHARERNISQAIQALQRVWQKYDSNDPFEYTFLDVQFQKNYDADNRLAGIVGYFTGVAILISCLGLLGLAAFNTEQRTKEIGIRKVLGASVAKIVSILSIEFLRLILISLVIASPIAWWVMDKWLREFAYRKPIDWTIFAYTAVIAITIGLLTIGSQTIKAALTNPIKSLKSE
jgi:putative ABC transport system permease protein